MNEMELEEKIQIERRGKDNVLNSAQLKGVKTRDYLAKKYHLGGRHTSRQTTTNSHWNFSSG